MTELLTRVVRDESGQDLIEYALLAGFIALAVIATLILTGTALQTLYGSINSQINSAS